MAPSRSQPVPILFVGGTGRSGTHIAARLVTRSREYAIVPVECRFHTDEDGFPGLLAGEVSKRRFIRRMRRHWWRSFQTNRFRGMFRFVPRERFEAALDAFEGRFDAEPDEACRALFFDLLWPVTTRQLAAGEEPAIGIVEQSCDVIAQAPTLTRLFGEARYLHVVRDGRDASASRVSQTRGPTYPRNRDQGLEWWEARIRRLDAGARVIGEDCLHEFDLGELLDPDTRIPALLEVAHFAGISAQPRMRRLLRRRINPATANAERWRDGLSASRQAEIETRYAEILEGLERDGVTCAPLLRNAYERARP